MTELFQQLLLENLQIWEAKIGERKTQKEFAEEVLEIHEVTFNALFTGRKPPTKNMLIRLAEKTGDPRFYDLAGAPRPDLDLQYIRKVWDKLSPESRAAIREKAEEYVTIENENEKRG